MLSMLPRILGQTPLFALSSFLLFGCAAKLEMPEDFAFLKGPTQDAGSRDASDGDAAGNEPPNLPPPTSCAADIFQNICGSAACHGSESMIYIDLESEGVSARLLDGPTSAAGACEGRTFVSSSNAGDLLLQKVSENPPCGVRMPFGKPVLTAEQVKCLSDYVSSLKSAEP